MATSGRFVRSAGLISGLTLVSRILGLARECTFGYFFSTTEPLSAFRIAFMIPNLARRLFGEGALSAALIPTLTKSIQTDGDETSRRFVGRLLILLTLLLVGVIVLVEIGIAAWRTVTNDPALELAAILMPYMAMICTVAVAGGVLNVRGHFAVPAAAPALLNIAIVTAVVIGSGAFGLSGRRLMYVVCVGVLAGGVLQLIATGAAMRFVSFVPRWSLGGLGDPRVRQTARLMGPMVLGLSAVQINSLTDYLIAYWFVTQDGVRVGPAVLGYAQYLYQLPLGVFGIALATAIFPELSRRSADRDQAGLAAVFAHGVRLSLFIALPATVGLVFVARPLVATLYQRGAFTAADTARVSATLVYYSLGLAAYFLHHIVVRTFYALSDSRTPARIALRMVGANLAMNVALVFALQERGLALATAICAWIQLAWLMVHVGRTVPEIEWRSIARGVARIVVATGGMAIALIALALGLPGLGDAARLTLLFAAGALTYAALARRIHIGELADIRRIGGAQTAEKK
jgi:putative peptidoglycan lipid II flippase